MNSLISVVVTLFNYEAFVADCIKSVLNQDWDNFELIIVDDASTDSSLAIARKFESEKVKVVSFESNRGYSVAKNEGIIASQGDYIAMLDADDLLTKDSLSVRMRAMQDKGVMLVHANAINVVGSISLKECYKINPKGAKRLHPKIHAQTVLVDRRVHKEHGLYDENLRSRSDKEMWWRLFGKDCKGPFLVPKAFISDDVAYYRIHKKSMTAMRRRRQKYNEKVTKLLERAYLIRQAEGITPQNTRFLQ